MGGNFKVKCLDARGCSGYTNGKIYEVVDGVFTYNSGNNIIGIDSFDEFNNMTSAIWELVEDSSDLRELIKPCYAVRIRDGRWLIAFTKKDGDIAMQDITDISYGVTAVSNFEKNTLNHRNSEQYDIMEIRGYANADQTNIENRDVIWKREEKSPTQLKLEELEKKQREIADEMENLRKEL